jgi:YQGE family putative transporter
MVSRFLKWCRRRIIPGHNILEYTSTKDKNRDIYFGFNTFLGSIISVVIPIIGGLIISQKLISFLPDNPFANYYFLFIIISLVFLTGIFYIFKLPSSLPPKIKVYQPFKSYRSKVWRLIGIREFIDGFKSGAIVFLSVIFVFIILDTEFNVGIFTGIFSLMGGVVALIVGDKLIGKKQNRLKFGLFGAIFLAIARAVYVFFFNIFGLLISAGIKLFAGPMFSISLAPSLYDAVDHSIKHKKRFYQYLVAREIPLATGRILSILLLLLLLKFGTDIIIGRIWFMIIGLFPLIFWAFTKRFEKILAKKIKHQSNR